jgi:ATPase subunit of ABC transporter with duplicated ATPase domains
MAGLVLPSNGDARPAPCISVRLLAQEPVLDESKTVLGNVRDGVAEILALRARYESIVTRLAEDCSEQLITEMGSLARAIGHKRRLGYRRPPETGHGGTLLPAT